MDLKRGFAEFDHSGDIGIEAKGNWFGELVENATRGLFGLMYSGEVAPQPAHRTMTVMADTREALLADWLGAVISACAVHGELYSGVEIVTASPTRLKGHLFGEALDPNRHDLRFDVKAATYHGLAVHDVGDGFTARIVFDL